jgi:DNA-binding CsgD family transcriptional regulator
MMLAVAELAAGDVDRADAAAEAGWQSTNLQPKIGSLYVWRMALLALIRGAVVAARDWADQAVSASPGGYHRAVTLTVRAQVAIAQDEIDQAEQDAHDALAYAVGVGAHLEIPNILECIAGLTARAGSPHEAARLFGAADSIRRRLGIVRFKINDADYTASVGAMRTTLGAKEFDCAWAEGSALSPEEAVAYARRGRGARKRPSSGWASLTPTEHDVVRLVSEGLATKEIATRLFVSPRTVQSHLTPHLHQTRSELPRATRPRSLPAHLIACCGTATATPGECVDIRGCG